MFLCNALVWEAPVVSWLFAQQSRLLRFVHFVCTLSFSSERQDTADYQTSKCPLHYMVALPLSFIKEKVGKKEKLFSLACEKKNAWDCMVDKFEDTRAVNYLLFYDCRSGSYQCWVADSVPVPGKWVFCKQWGLSTDAVAVKPRNKIKPAVVYPLEVDPLTFEHSKQTLMYVSSTPVL